MQKIVLFDFDGTITKKDSLFEFIKFVKGPKALIIGLAALLPWLLLHKMGLLSSQITKEKVLTYFFKGMHQYDFNKNCEAFAEFLDGLIRPEAKEKIKQYRLQNLTMVIISASIENWIIPWANRYDLKVIATKIEFIDQKVTGRITGINCNGAEKVIRLKQAFDLNKVTILEAYGDSKGDIPMLALAKQKFFRPFH